MAWFILLVALSVAAPPSPLDRAAIQSLRHAVTTLESTQSRKQFERLAPKSRIDTWQRLQHQFRYPRPGAADLAFVLAYYGVDYRRNIERLLIPYRRWRRGIAPAEARFMHEVDLLESLPEDLMLLYQKHHDGYSLGTLLDLQLDGDYAEQQADALTALWDDDAEVATILRLAAGSSRRLGNTEDMLQINADDLKERGEIFAQLRRLTRHRDRRVARVARRVILDLRAAFKQSRG